MIRLYTAQIIAQFLNESLGFYSNKTDAIDEISEIVESEVSADSVAEIVNFWNDLNKSDQEKMIKSGEIIGIIQKMARHPVDEQEAA